MNCECVGRSYSSGNDGKLNSAPSRFAAAPKLSAKSCPAADPLAPASLAKGGLGDNSRRCGACLDYELGRVPEPARE